MDIAAKKTTPPPRYSEATLLAEMERQGIGTKSTRPLMIDTLKRRAYVHIQRHIVVATERGVKFIESIEKPWGEYISPQFTARVETDMEQVAQGKKNWEELVDSERRSFTQAIDVFRIRP
jgi:DNA topoisomerase-1